MAISGSRRSFFFGQQIATLGYLYRIDIEEELASILPPDVLGSGPESE
jgi:hypothetical protein